MEDIFITLLANTDQWLIKCQVVFVASGKLLHTTRVMCLAACVISYFVEMIDKLNIKVKNKFSIKDNFFLNPVTMQLLTSSLQISFVGKAHNTLQTSPK